MEPRDQREPDPHQGSDPPRDGKYAAGDGGPEAPQAELDKVYIKPSLLRVSQTGIDYGDSEGKPDKIERLPSWVKDKVLRGLFP